MRDLKRKFRLSSLFSLFKFILFTKKSLDIQPVASQWFARLAPRLLGLLDMGRYGDVGLKQWRLASSDHELLFKLTELPERRNR